MGERRGWGGGEKDRARSDDGRTWREARGDRWIIAFNGSPAQRPGRAGSTSRKQEGRLEWWRSLRLACSGGGEEMKGDESRQVSLAPEARRRLTPRLSPPAGCRSRRPCVRRATPRGVAVSYVCRGAPPPKLDVVGLPGCVHGLSGGRFDKRSWERDFSRDWFNCSEDDGDNNAVRPLCGAPGRHLRLRIAKTLSTWPLKGGFFCARLPQRHANSCVTSASFQFKH